MATPLTKAATQYWVICGPPFGRDEKPSSAALRIAYLEQPNCALRVLPGLIGEPTLGIRIVLTGPNSEPFVVPRLQVRAVERVRVQWRRCLLPWETP